jgi:hypothetical protein
MSTIAKHFSPRASLAALGLKLRRLHLLKAITNTVKVPQKTVRHTPAEKLYNAFVAILSGAHDCGHHAGRVEGGRGVRRRSAERAGGVSEPPAGGRRSGRRRRKHESVGGRFGASIFGLCKPRRARASVATLCRPG